MIRFNWNDFIISAQLFQDKIIINAIPIHIKNLIIENQGIEPIQKAFEGQVIENNLKAMIREDKNQLRNIIKFYEYLCKCFSSTQKMKIQQAMVPKTKQKVVICREWSLDQRTNAKKQRISIKIFLLDQLKNEAQLEQSYAYYTIKLKEVYLTVNNLLLKCNTIILAQLDYFKEIQKRLEQKMRNIQKKMDEKINNLFENIRNQMKKITNINKYATNSDFQLTKKVKKHKKKSSRQIDEAVKVEEVKKSDEETLKYEENQQSDILKNVNQLQPRQKIIPLPIQFDHQNPAYHFFSISNKTVEKNGGYDYPMIMLKQIIPQTGTHGIMIKYVIEKKLKRSCCLEIGIIDERIKQLLHSSVCDNYVMFKCNISTVIMKVNNQKTKRKYGKVRVLRPGETVQLLVNIERGFVSWIFSFGQTVRIEIPQELRNMKLKAFVGIYTTGDTVEFLDYLQL